MLLGFQKESTRPVVLVTPPHVSIEGKRHRLHQNCLIYENHNARQRSNWRRTDILTGVHSSTVP